MVFSLPIPLLKATGYSWMEKQITLSSPETKWILIRMLTPLKVIIAIC